MYSFCGDRMYSMNSCELCVWTQAAGCKWENGLTPVVRVRGFSTFSTLIKRLSIFLIPALFPFLFFPHSPPHVSSFSSPSFLILLPKFPHSPTPNIPQSLFPSPISSFISQYYSFSSPIFLIYLTIFLIFLSLIYSYLLLLTNIPQLWLLSLIFPSLIIPLQETNCSTVLFTVYTNIHILHIVKWILYRY